MNSERSLIVCSSGAVITVESIQVCLRGEILVGKLFLIFDPVSNPASSAVITPLAVFLEGQRGAGTRTGTHPSNFMLLTRFPHSWLATVVKLAAVASTATKSALITDRPLPRMKGRRGLGVSCLAPMNSCASCLHEQRIAERNRTAYKLAMQQLTRM